MDTLLSLGVGLGLSAACGFRVFVPLLVASIAAQAGHYPLSPGFEWIGTREALLALTTATLLEVLAYYIPWLDNALDAIATPAAVAAGMIVSASVLTDLPPLLKWGAALVGGGVAGIAQGASVLLRLKSALFTGGLGNPLVSTAELVAAIVLALLALFLPLACLVLTVGLCVAAFRLGGRLVFGRRRNRGGASPPA
jgi:hypothetical protein